MAKEREPIEFDRALAAAEKEIFTAFEIADADEKKLVRRISAGYLLAQRVNELHKPAEEKKSGFWD